MAMNLGIGGPPKKRGVPPPPFGGGDRGGTAAKAAPAFAPKGGADAVGAAVDEGDAPDAGAGGEIPPEAVCYRSETETCGSCVYNEGGQCSKLSIPVSDGDGCNLFKDRSGGDLESGEAEAPADQTDPMAA